MVTKKCFKCLAVLPIEEFYKHFRMADGHLNKCKSCTKSDVKNHYCSKRQFHREYERERFKRPERKQQFKESKKRRDLRFPEKTKAHRAVAYAIKKGVLVRMPCEICGNFNVQAHHDDYFKPLDVRWLCFKHHREIGHGQKVG